MEEHCVNDIPTFAVETLQWLSGHNKARRQDFFKKFSLLFPDDELKEINVMVHHMQRSRKIPKKTKQIQTTTKDNEAPSTSSAAVFSPLGIQSPSVFLPVAEERWWSTYGHGDVVSLDVEFVSKPIDLNTCVKEVYYEDRKKCIRFRHVIEGRKVRYKQEIGTISVCRSDYSVKTWKQKHLAESYVVNKFTRDVNGFDVDDFSAGNECDYNSVVKFVKEEIRNKLVFVCGGAQDITCLGITMGNLDVFDLQSHFKRLCNNDIVGYKLKVLGNFYFPNAEFQTGPHNCEEDSKMTLRLFMDVYKVVKTSCLSEREGEEIMDELPRINKK